ncbi:MAG TPA: type VII secretion protein EccB [Dietzia timorensis]|uniref:Type VII secretion protein EccB n=1 Tax=Dietzia timorensis TaxID=499555 RepID=A0A921F2W8_9ACTN|nr:type VII secretion protein EccB [Dietzia timorensis]HJE90430.1 type VII secretion protein EccB [Dietzia timorensis]
MPLEPTSSEQVDGHKFILSRARTALVGGDMTSRSDRLGVHVRAAVAGAVICAVLLAGAALLAFIRPAPNLDGKDVLQSKDTGALFVRIDDRFHPVPDLASARLVLGSPVTPERVPEETIAEAPRGPALGIPGGPAIIPGASDRALTWSACDGEIPRTGGSVTAIVAAPEEPADSWSPQEGIVVNRGGQGWLVADGRRTRIDLGDSVLMDVFGLGSWPQHTLSDTVLELLPEGPPLARIEVPNTGAPAPHGPAGFVVGEVFTVEAATETEHYVVVADGVQKIPALVADLLRAEGPSARSPHNRVVAPANLTAPKVVTLDLAGLPRALPKRADVDGAIVCSWWAADGVDGPVRSGMYSARQLADISGRPTTYLAGADAGGTRIDAVSLPAGGVVAKPVSIAAGGTASPGLALITDGGVRNSVPDTESAEALGLDPGPVVVPSPLVQRLVAGPELRRENALLAVDARGGVAGPIR